MNTFHSGCGLQTDAVHHSAECVVLSWPGKPAVQWYGGQDPLCTLSDLGPSILSSVAGWESLGVRAGCAPLWVWMFQSQHGPVHVAAQTTAWWRGRSKPVRCHAFPATGLEVKGSSPPSSPVMKRGAGLRGAAEQWSSHDKYGEIWLIAPSWGWTRLALAPCTKCPAFFTSGPRMLSSPKPQQTGWPLLLVPLGPKKQ